MKLDAKYLKPLVFPFLFVKVRGVKCHEGFGLVLLFCVVWTVERKGTLPDGWGRFVHVELEEYGTIAFQFQSFYVLLVEQQAMVVEWKAVILQLKYKVY